MAASVNNKSSCWKAPEVYKHHEQHRVCISRPKYREGRKAKAVKVYTINLESRYVMVQGVPAIGVMSELIQLCALYGAVDEYRPLDEYPAEEFTEVYLVKFQRVPSARAAKRHMDETSFFGGVLHVCYVPEYETVDDTRLKLQDRRRYIMRSARDREKEQVMNTEPSEATSGRISPRLHQMPEQGHPGEGSNMSRHNSSFPPLPPPPKEHHSHRRERLSAPEPTEDRMGTLHDAVVDSKQQPVPSSSTSRSSVPGDGGAQCRLAPTRSSAVRFVPRTTCLEKRKRKLVEVEPHMLFDDTAKNDTLVGPKLPEAPKLDMEDESLNTTVSLIRNTLKQVETLVDVKPVGKKIKPRRRI